MHEISDLQGLAADILYEDNHLIAINKHPGDIVQGDKTGDIPLSDIVKAYIGERYGKPGDVFLGVVHRLDRPVSGVVLFARTSKALARMNTLMQKRDVRKIYWAVTDQPTPAEEGRARHFLAKDQEKNKSFVVSQSHPQGREAILDYHLTARTERYYLIEVELHTGRHHQIRAQLAALGCPIRGDLKYGFPRSNPDGSISLHSRSMSFTHPVRPETVTIIAPTPADPLWTAIVQTVAGREGKK